MTDAAPLSEKGRDPRREEVINSSWFRHWKTIDKVAWKGD